MTELKRPNLHSQRATTGAAFVTVYANRSDVGISQAAFERMDASDDHYLHLAFDPTWAPYVGAVAERTPQQEPAVQASNLKVTSSLMCQQLVSVVDGEVPQGSIRFYFSGDDLQDQKTGATLYRLRVPSV